MPKYVTITRIFSRFVEITTFRIGKEADGSNLIDYNLG
jgi:hypothetical protein